MTAFHFRSPKARKKAKKEKAMPEDLLTVCTSTPADDTHEESKDTILKETTHDSDVPGSSWNTKPNPTVIADNTTSVGQKNNPWKVVDSSNLEISSRKPIQSSLLPIEETEEDESGASSSESEAEILPTTVELRRSTRMSRCKRSFKEQSDEDSEEVG